MKKFRAQLPLLALALVACTNAATEPETQRGEANERMHQRPHEDLIRGFESPGRDAWQTPDVVMELLGDLQGKTVMDLGSGSGYFSFRLAQAGANVICGDVDEKFLDHIRTRMRAQGVAAERMELRHLPYDSPDLGPGEVDMVLVVNTYHHIEERVAYFAKVKAGLKADGKLVVIDFFERKIPVGPPASIKLTHSEVTEELRAAGFGRVDADLDSLQYQYVVTAAP